MSGLSLKFKCSLDGAYSDNVPILDKNTVTVSPFAGGADICPPDDQTLLVNISNTIVSVSLSNFKRIVSVLNPPDHVTLAKITKQGFKDALRFLQTRPEASGSIRKNFLSDPDFFFQEILKVSFVVQQDEKS